METFDEYERSFEFHLNDSLLFMQFAQDGVSGFDGNESFCRAAVTSSLLLLEAAANSCIDSLQFESSVYHEIDRLPILSKFELFVRLRFPRKRLDRGTHHIEILRELRAMRDSLVHPKHVKQIWRDTSEDEAEKESDLTPKLKIERSLRFRNAEEALTVMRAVHGFLAYFFRDVCRFSPRQVSAMVFSKERVPDISAPTIPYYDRSMRALLRDWKLDLRYLKLGYA